MTEDKTVNLTPRQKRRIALAFVVVLVVVAVGSALYTFLVLGAEARRLDALTLLRHGEERGLAAGTKVLLTGTVHADNPHLIHALVAGCEETQPSAGESWRSGRTYNQPLRLDHGGDAAAPLPPGYLRDDPRPKEQHAALDRLHTGAEAHRGRRGHRPWSAPGAR